MKQTKKGFTLVELLVVIAILAILATVSVVGYTSFITKANISNDTVIARELTTLIQATDITDPVEDFDDVINVLYQNGFLLANLNTKTQGCFFVWESTNNQILLVTRFRNGKTETNSPSRFIREVDRKYIANPIETEDEERDDEKPSVPFGWGRPAGSRNRFGAGGYSYGASGPVKTETSRQPSAVRPVRPSASSPVPVRRAQVIPKRVSDAEFEPTPVLQLRAGQRIEHNRFGFGKILEITGGASDLKAKIAFDDHGEKILLLKYAKIRIVNLA